MKCKKSMSAISIVISLAAVMILVIIYISIFSEKSGIFSKNINSCDTKGGKCLKGCGPDSAYVNFECQEKDQICCINPSQLT